MDAIRTDNYGGIPELLETMRTGISMLEAFSAMLGYTLGSGDGVPDISRGTECLIRQQCQDFEFIRSALCEQFDALREGKIHVRDIDEVARIVALSPDKVTQVLTFAGVIDGYSARSRNHG